MLFSSWTRTRAFAKKSDDARTNGGNTVPAAIPLLGASGASSSSSSNPGAGDQTADCLSCCGCTPSALDELLEAEAEKSQRPIDESPTSHFRLRTKEFTPNFLHNPHILSAYRVYFTPKLALASLFRWHNETINVWSHLLPAIYFAWRFYACLWLELPTHGAPSLLTIDETNLRSVATSTDYFAFAMFYGTLVTCFWWSSVYHLLGCCSYDTHRNLYRCDIAGILSLIWGSYVPALYYAFRCRPHLQMAYCTVITVLVASLLVLFNSRRCQLRQFHSLRVAAMVLTIAFAVLPTVHWCGWILPVDFPALDLGTFLLPLVAMLGSYATGFVFYSRNIPEAWSPGRFDLALQSHNWWHCWIVVAASIWEGELTQMFLRKSMAIC